MDFSQLFYRITDIKIIEMNQSDKFATIMNSQKIPTYSIIN